MAKAALLIVDDDAYLRTTLRQQFAAEGFFKVGFALTSTRLLLSSFPT